MNDIISTAFLEDKAKTINHLKNEMAMKAIEIGRHLAEAREFCKHGTWEKWCESECNFKKTEVFNYIRAYERFGNVQPVEHLGIHKLNILAKLPDEVDPEKFIEEHQVENLTVKALKDLIKSETITDAEKQQIKEIAEKSANEKYQGIIDNFKERMDKIFESKSLIEKELREKNKQLDEFEKQKKSNDELKKIKDEIDKLKQLRNNFQQELENARLLGKLKAQVDDMMSKIAYTHYIKFTDNPALIAALKRIVQPIESWIKEMNKIIERG